MRHSATLSTKNPKRSSLGLKQRLRAEKLVNNGHSHKLHFSATLDGIISVAIAQSVQLLPRCKTGPEFEFRQGKKTLIFSGTISIDPGAHPACCLKSTKSVKQPDREADHSLPSGAQVKNKWSITLIPPYPIKNGNHFWWNNILGKHRQFEHLFILILLFDLLLPHLWAGAHSKTVYNSS